VLMRMKPHRELRVLMVDLACNSVDLARNSAACSVVQRCCLLLSVYPYTPQGRFAVASALVGAPVAGWTGRRSEKDWRRSVQEAAVAARLLFAFWVNHLEHQRAHVSPLHSPQERRLVLGLFLDLDEPACVPG
jgi:hypothetical protein